MIGLALALLFLMTCVVGLTVAVRRMWRGDERTLRRMKTAFFRWFEPDVREAMARAVVPLILQLALMASAMVTVLVGISRVHGGGKFTPLTVSAIAMFAVSVAMPAVQAAIVWFNRPRFLVPPPLRDEVGVWASRRAARRFQETEMPEEFGFGAPPVRRTSSGRSKNAKRLKRSKRSKR